MFGYRLRNTRISPAQRSIKAQSLTIATCAGVIPSKDLVKGSLIFGSDETMNRTQFIIGLIIVSALLAPSMFCLIPGATLTPAEAECCRQMGSSCGDVQMGHSC